MNSHSTTSRLKHLTNFESLKNFRSSNVVEFELRHIPSVDSYYAQTPTTENRADR